MLLGTVLCVAFSQMFQVGFPGLRDMSSYESVILVQPLIFRVLDLPRCRDLGHQILHVLRGPAVKRDHDAVVRRV